MRHLFLLLALGLALGACSDGGPDATSGPRSEVRGKPAAPVEIHALRVDERGAEIEITFGTDALDVSVRAYGVDGLQVLGEEHRIRGGAFRSRETAVLDVPFAPARAPGLLAVRVEGTFAGRPGVRTVTFGVGDRAREAQGPDADVVEAGGERLRVTRARER